jgi:uncharacterized membrane protein YccC
MKPLSPHLTDARQALRVVVAAFAAVGVTRLFKLPQGYWAVITAIIVMQASVGASLRTALDRFAGSLLGAAAGVAMAWVLPIHEPWALYLALFMSVGPTAWYAASRPRYRLAPITAAIVLLTATSVRQQTMTLAFQRVAESLIGNVLGVGVALLVLPARAHTVVAQVAARVVGGVAELLDLYLGDAPVGDDQRVSVLQAQMRANVAALEVATDEARLEVKSRLTDEPDAEPLARAVRRLHNDVLMVGRAAAQAAPLPHLAAQRRALRECTDVYFAGLADALRDRSVPPDATLIVERLRAYAVEVERLRATDGLAGLEGPQVARLYAMGFSLEQLALDVGQLHDRIGDQAEEPPAKSDVAQTIVGKDPPAAA